MSSFRKAEMVSWRRSVGGVLREGGACDLCLPTILDTGHGTGKWRFKCCRDGRRDSDLSGRVLAVYRDALWTEFAVMMCDVLSKKRSRWQNQRNKSVVEIEPLFHVEEVVVPGQGGALR